MKKRKHVKDSAAVAQSKALMHKELEKAFLCGSCSLGFNDLEEYRTHHNDDEEHKYHVDRRVKIMVPGLGYCPACSQIIQTSSYWENHVECEKHSKCIASLRAIGISGDYGRPIGCTVSGQLADPMNHAGIDCALANSNGYGKPSNTAGVPIIGLNFVTQSSVATYDNQQFNCEVCDISFHYKDRLAHLSSIKHRMSYLKKYYNEWYEEVLKIPEILKQRMKNRLSFFAYKVEQREKESETSDAKVIRDKLFNLEKFLKFTKMNSKYKENKKPDLRNSQVRGPEPRRVGGPATHIVHNSRSHEIHGHRPGAYEPGPSRYDYEAPPPRSDARRGYDGHTRSGDRREPPPPPKRLRSGAGAASYSEQYEMDQALEAINVLERFNIMQAEQEVRDKMQTMRDAVLRGSRLSDLQGYGEMMSSMKGPSMKGPSMKGPSMKGPPRSIGRASPPAGHFPRTSLQEDLVDKHEPHRGPEYRGAHFGEPPEYRGAHFSGPPEHRGAHFGGPPTPEYMHHGHLHHAERPGHYRR